MYTTRQLLDFLAQKDPTTVARLCQLRGLRARGVRARCETLARSYRGEVEPLLVALRKPELIALLADPTEIDDAWYCLPSARNYPRDTLVEMAVSLFRDEELPDGFRQLNPQADEDEEPEDGEEDEEGGESHHRSEDYRRTFAEEMAFSSADAALPLRDYQEKAIVTMLAELDPRTPKLLHLATGGGKTRVANTLVQEWLAKHGGPILWVTKDWRLLFQAARDASRRHAEIELGRVGGEGTPLHPLTEGVWTDIVYTTIQTLTRRLEKDILKEGKPTLVVWDECHWGEHGKTGKVLTACKRRGIPVLGLTATPHASSRYQIGFSKTFRELVDECFLARPIIKEPVLTGVSWRPQFRGRFDDVSRASLQELAESRRRNELIVEHYATHTEQYGKTIFFACSIEHVNRLTELLARRGIAARGMHSQQFDSWNQRALEDFRTGAIQVLVNMEMLTHGVDIPDARSVFLCRPTTSDILFAQMIGRASRRDEAAGKTSFFVVEFTDNVQDHGQLFTSAQRYFTGSGLDGSSSSLRASRGARPRDHAFNPRGAPTWVPDLAEFPESARGLWYRHGQTFGIEFELTPLDGGVPELGPAWLRVAEELRSRLAAALPGRVALKVIQGYAGNGSGKDCSVWNVEYDRTAGWEVTTRVLAGLDGFIEVDLACRVLNEATADLGLRVNHRTGTHVHIGWLGGDVGEVKRAVQLARLFEPALGTLVAPSRLAVVSAQGYDTRRPNPFCRPLATVFSRKVLARVRTIEDIRRIAEVEEARYVTFNLRPLSQLHTAEIRMHNGTLEARKILLWVSLWQQILWAAAHRDSIPDTPDAAVIQPHGDILRLAQDWLPDARQPQQQGLLRRLASRRSEIVEEQWRRAPSLAPWLAAVASWSALPEPGLKLKNKQGANLGAS